MVCLRRPITALTFVFVLTTGVLGAWAFWFEPASIAVRRHEIALPSWQEACKGHLSAPMSVYAVLGNHDYWFDGGRIQRALARSGIEVLDDRARPGSSVSPISGKEPTTCLAR
jgi:predicted MPP superfamily phosphohydrolase